MSPTSTPPKLFTIGYARHTPTTLLDRLVANNVEVLIDVRELPLSRKAGFSKSALAKAAEHRGVEYRHFKSLGVPSRLRKERKLGEVDGREYLEAFRRILKTQSDVLFDALGAVEEKLCCLLCLEENPGECHRTVVAEELQRMRPGGLDVVNL
jgi:uncharacterized protein (DUF488 family)